MGIITFKKLPRKIKGSPGESIYEEIRVVNCGTVPTHHLSVKAKCDAPGADVSVFPESVYKLNGSREEEFQVRIRFPSSLPLGDHSLNLRIDNMENLPDEGSVLLRVTELPVNICALNQLLKCKKD
jgi:uncharacterized membrane protein